MAMPPKIPPQPPKPATQTSDVITQRGIDRLRELHKRALLGATRRIRLNGAAYVNGATWKHTDPAPVKVYAEVTGAGALGSTLTFDGDSIPADMIGGTTRAVALDMNEYVDVQVSDAAIQFVLVVTTPELR